MSQGEYYWDKAQGEYYREYSPCALEWILTTHFKIAHNIFWPNSTLQGLIDFSWQFVPSYPLKIVAPTLYICVPKTLVGLCFLKVWLLNIWWSLSYRKYSESNNNCWVEKKAEEQFSESVHCYSPTPLIQRRRPKNKMEEQFWESVLCYSPTPPIEQRSPKHSQICVYSVLVYYAGEWYEEIKRAENTV